MEQIAKILFATTVLTIFSYLLFFSSMTHSGNGGEYWDYNGIVEPNEAAQDSYGNRDYRFLAVNLAIGSSRRHIIPQEYQICDNHPFGAANSLHLSSTEPIHSTESLYLATHFATRYNETMMYLLADLMNKRCEKWIEE